MNIIKGQTILAWVLLSNFMSALLFSGVSAFTTSPSRGIRRAPRRQNRIVYDYDTSKSTQHQEHFSQPSRKSVLLAATANDEENSNKQSLPFYLDPNTKGGVVVLTFVLFLGTYITDQIFINVLNYDEIDAGITIGMGFTVLSTLAWMSTYLFRVATKDMTYVSIDCYFFLL